jgi:hypothetical protein
LLLQRHNLTREELLSGVQDILAGGGLPDRCDIRHPIGE